MKKAQEGWKMKKIVKITLVYTLALLMVGAIAGCVNRDKVKVTDEALGIPKLVNLGSTMCVPCRMMEPELEELEKEYDGILYVEKIDVIRNQDRARYYGVNMIPVQIFFDKDGNELERNLGFISKEDIVKKFAELGIDL